MKKLLALLMALALVFSLAACGPNNEEPTEDNSGNNASDSSTPSESDSTPSESDSASDSASDSGEDSKAPSNEGPNELALPKDAAAGVKLYNDAVAKIASQSTNVKRELTKTDSSVGDLNTFGDVSGKFAAGSGPVNVKLANLNAADVKSFSSSENGDNYVLTFNLKTKTGGAELKHGNGGYMYFLTMDEVGAVVTDIGKAIGGDGFKIEINAKKSSLTLDGNLVVTINKTTGKISTAVLSLTEAINGSCKALGAIPVKADLIGKATVTFTAS